MNDKLSIIIVNFNTKDILIACLKTLGKYRVMIVDNGSTDGSVEEVRKRFSRVAIIRNAINRGFAAANNQGIARTKSDYVLLLNSDTRAESDAIDSVIQYLEAHPDVGVATCKLVLDDGRIDPACHRGFPTPWAAFTYFSGLEKLFPKSRVFSQYHQWYKDLSNVHEIDSPSGAFFMVRGEVINQVGLLDESFFMYGEDLDWAYRIKQAGWKIVFIPDVSVTHLKKRSGRSHEDRERQRASQRYFYETMLQFYKKHFQQKYSFFISVLVTFVIKLRLYFL